MGMRIILKITQPTELKEYSAFFRLHTHAAKETYGSFAWPAGGSTKNWGERNSHMDFEIASMEDMRAPGGLSGAAMLAHVRVGLFVRLRASSNGQDVWVHVCKKLMRGEYLGRVEVGVDGLPMRSNVTFKKHQVFEVA